MFWYRQKAWVCCFVGCIKMAFIICNAHTHTPDPMEQSTIAMMMKLMTMMAIFILLYLQCNRICTWQVLYNKQHQKHTRKNENTHIIARQPIEMYRESGNRCPNRIRKIKRKTLKAPRVNC